MKVIFCDIDGVLNNAATRGFERSPSGYTGVSDELIRNLKKIVDASGAVIVLSSDWRQIKEDPDLGKDYRYLEGKLRSAGGLEIAGHTPDIRWRERGREILLYLEEHPEVTDYVVLDDHRFEDFTEGSLPEHLVLTVKEAGLTEHDAGKAIRILNGE